MACVGIVGGLGVGATVHYYEKIAAACKARGVVPDLVIVHADVDRGQGLVRDGKLDQLADYLAGFIDRHGARRRAAAAIPAVTPHICIAQLTKRIAPAPDQHRRPDRRGIARAQDRAGGAVRHDLHHGRPPVGPALRRRDREAAARRDRLRRQGLSTHPRQPARPTPTTPRGLRRIAADLQRRDGVEAILLAGTDLAVMFDEPTAGFPAIDVARLHIDAIVERLTVESVISTEREAVDIAKATCAPSLRRGLLLISTTGSSSLRATRCRTIGRKSVPPVERHGVQRRLQRKDGDAIASRMLLRRLQQDRPAPRPRSGSTYSPISIDALIEANPTRRLALDHEHRLAAVGHRHRKPSGMRPPATPRSARTVGAAHKLRTEASCRSQIATASSSAARRTMHRCIARHRTASEDLAHADDLAEAAADMLGGFGREALDLDLDRQRDRHRPGRRRAPAPGRAWPEARARAAARPVRRRLRNSIGRWRNYA